jgi:H+/Cl- antiporter ClcA
MNQRWLWIFFAALTGFLAGLAATVFLVLLKIATEWRESHSVILWFLPAAGFFIAWVYERWGGVSRRGAALILDEIHQPKNVLPLRMAPLVFGGTLLTHLFGGSAGREGTVVQMGACFGDNVSKWWKVSADQRRALLMAGAGAGFGAAIGAPLAGFIFGMEVIYIGHLRVKAVGECAVASLVAKITTDLLHAPHTHFGEVFVPHFRWLHLVLILAAGVAFGVSARAFIWLTHQVERIFAKTFQYPPWRTTCAGLILAAIFRWGHLERFAGLGLSEIKMSLAQIMTWQEPALKVALTALTIGAGFKGGEFIPLVFVGSTLGSSIAAASPDLMSTLAGCGFAAVFAGAANTPIACAMMAAEVFGVALFPYALLTCFLSQYFSGTSGIYKGQPIENLIYKVEKFFLHRSGTRR